MKPIHLSRLWDSKRDWHGRQRALPVREKIAILIQLQERQQTINQSKIAMGLPPVPMRIWKTQP